MRTSRETQSHRPVIVVLAMEPGLRHDIVRSTLEAHADMRVVSADASAEDVTHQVRAISAEALVIEGRGSERVPDYCLRLLQENPSLVVVIIDPAMRTASVVSMRPTRSRYHDVSIDMLAEQIRRRLDVSHHAATLLEVPE